MSYPKIIISTLVAAAVLGGFYLMAFLGPKPVKEEEIVFFDPIADGETLLKESERLEAEFESAASANALSAESLTKLRKSIVLQEQYIDKAKNLDRSPAQRLQKLQTRLQNIEAAPLFEKLENVLRNAEKAEKDEDFDGARDLYRQAYDIQSKINSDYVLSKYKDISRSVYFDRQAKMLEARPLYLKTLDLEKRAREALAAKDADKAEKLFESTIEAISQLHSQYPTSTYTDFARLMRMEIELASIKSGGLAQQIFDHVKAAEASEKKGEYLIASEAYADAAEKQRTLNRLYPQSTFASDEKVSELEAKKTEAFSWKFANEITEQDNNLTRAIFDGKISIVGEISANLLRKTEHFTKNFPQSKLIDSDIVMRLRYINFMLRDIPKIQALVMENLAACAGDPKLKMLKTEVTQELYSIVMQENPSRYADNPKRPVDSVTFDDVKRFCNRVNWLLGRKVYIPSERVYRDTLGSLRYVDLNEISWNNLNSGGITHPAGAKKPNDRGFYDLVGNVAEYIAPKTDNYEDEIQTFGGSAQTPPDTLSDSLVSSMDPKQRNRMVGFRILVDVSGEAAKNKN